MRVQTFMGKAMVEGLAQMDKYINDWIAKHRVTPLHIKQSFGLDRHHDGRNEEPIVIITVWYDESEYID